MNPAWLGNYSRDSCNLQEFSLCAIMTSSVHYSHLTEQTNTADYRGVLCHPKSVSRFLFFHKQPLLFFLLAGEGRTQNLTRVYKFGKVSLHIRKLFGNIPKFNRHKTKNEVSCLTVGASFFVCSIIISFLFSYKDRKVITITSRAQKALYGQPERLKIT